MPPRSFARLSVDTLEDRTLPATWGVPWPDPGHLTLSFVPDGTDVSGSPSNLFAQMTADGFTSTSAWETAIARAAQTWADVTNINIGVVSDGGQALGAVGAAQGDSRFGDIRVSARPLSSGVIALTSGFTYSGSTWGGDVVLNSNYRFGTGPNLPAGTYDLYTVALHELGHSLGIGDTATDGGSVMYDNYQYLTGLAPQDVSEVQSLYGGVRAPDAFSAGAGNHSAATAAPINAVTQGTVTGDITRPGEVDYYKFANLMPGLGALASPVVRLHTSGASLLAAKVTVYDASGNVVGSGAATDPLNGDLLVSLHGAAIGATYTFSVAGNRSDAFGVGDYQASVGVQSLNGTVTVAGGTATVGGNSSVLSQPANVNLNSTLSTALNLLPVTTNPSDPRFDYLYKGVITSLTPTAYFQLAAPAAANPGAPTNLRVMVWGADESHLQTRVSVYGSNGNPVAFQVLANGGGEFSIQVANVTPGSSYYLKVTAANPAALLGLGTYFLAAKFDQGPLTTLSALTGGTLGGAGSAQDNGTLTLTDSRLMTFSLAAAGDPGTSVTMTVTDASGRTVLSLTAQGGQLPVTAVYYFQAGSYKVTFKAWKPYGQPGVVTYGLFGDVLDEPVGPYAPPPSAPAPSGGTSPSSPSSPSSGSTSPSSSTSSTPPPPDTFTSLNGPSSSPPPSYGYYY